MKGGRTPMHAFAAVMVCLVAVQAWGQAARNLDRIVKSGTETMIAVHSSFTASEPGGPCIQGPLVPVVVVAPPKNGVIAIRPAPERNPACSNVVQGTGVFYTPNPGYVGPDTLSYDRQGNARVAGIRNVKIQVVP